MNGRDAKYVEALVADADNCCQHIWFRWQVATQFLREKCLSQHTGGMWGLGFNLVGDQKGMMLSIKCQRNCIYGVCHI